MRSIPEKTLEHWTSIYLSNRFPNAALWWPATGEDVLAELPRLAETGPGKTLALELKTTEVTSAGHKLLIDTEQLKRYLNPPFGPPLPIYYVFPVPCWSGSLTSWHGWTPPAVGGVPLAPPEWWRLQAGASWFGKWLYVLSAQSVAAALSPGWRQQETAQLFVIKDPPSPGKKPPWRSLFAGMPGSEPLRWRKFWDVAKRCGPLEGVRWLTVADSVVGSGQIRVLSEDEESLWDLGTLLDRPRRADARAPVVRVETEQESAAPEHVLLHIPASYLR